MVVEHPRGRAAGKKSGANPDTPALFGPIAQTGERLPCKQDVVGSTPAGSTILVHHLLRDSGRVRVSYARDGVVRLHLPLPPISLTTFGDVAQMGERLRGTQKVAGIVGRNGPFESLWGCPFGTVA